MPDPGLDVFADNDAVRKLAACDLLREWHRLFPDLADTHVLPEARFFFGLSGKKSVQAKRRERFGRNVHSRVGSFLQDAVVVASPDPSHPLLVKLGETEDMDGGELVLLVAALGSGNGVVLTGDKRFIRAISAFRDREDPPELVGVRFRCLEQALHVSVRELGFAEATERIKPGRSEDGSIRICWGHEHQLAEAEVIQNLRSCVDALRKPVDCLDAWPEAPAV